MEAGPDFIALVVLTYSKMRLAPALVFEALKWTCHVELWLINLLGTSGSGLIFYLLRSEMRMW